MVDSPISDQQFRNMMPVSLVGDLTISALEDIQLERSEILAAMKRYLGYLNTLLPQDAEWLRARGYLLYLVQQLKALGTDEDTTLQEFFKSSNELAMDHAGLH